jgi:DNA mismatch repair protein MutL
MIQEAVSYLKHHKRVVFLTSFGISVAIACMLSVRFLSDGVKSSLNSEMEKMGFSLSPLSGNDWAVNAIPAGLDGVDASAMVQQILESVENGGMPLKRRILEHLALTVARSAAIPAGRTLIQEEMDILVADLLRLPEPNYTPDGKTIITVIPMEQINKMF